MPTILNAITLLVALGGLALLFLIWQKLKQPVGQGLDQALRDELRQSRTEASDQARQLRTEVSDAQTKANETLVRTVNTLGENQKALLDQLTKATKDAATDTRGEIEKLVERTNAALKEIQTSTDSKLEALRQTTKQEFQASQESHDRRGAETIKTVQALTESNRKELEGQRDKIQSQLQMIQTDTETKLEAVRQTTEQKLQASQDAQERRGAEVIKAVQTLTETNRKELDGQREKIQSQLTEVQKANEGSFKQVRDTLDGKLRQMMEDQKTQLADVVTALKGLEKTHQDEQQKAHERLDKKFQQIQESNEKKLEEMRKTVDEKLHDTLEKRLGESFKLVSDRLEAVQRGLGEMQTLATGVGDLKRVLTNVKERGTWGEYQLGAILEQILTPEQYGRNVHVQEGRETVEFAVKLPGRDSDQDKPVWLPIDAKFPKEDYERLVAASAAADKDGVEQAANALLKQVAGMARDISDKYIAPPATTDFGILFLPTEGLYAEVLRQPGFQDELQRKYRVMVAGPTTLSAILSSLRVGFQTLVIEKRAHEVWTVLGAVKTEFGKFGEVLDKVKKQLNTASTTIDQTAVRTRAMERQLRKVEQLPADQAAVVLELPAAADTIGLGESHMGDGEENAENN
jgi:DNA recombination protein RmuC